MGCRRIFVLHFHVIFAISQVLRVVAAVLAFSVIEPKSRSTVHVFEQLIGVTPIRVLRFPLGLYRSFKNGNNDRTAKDSEGSTRATAE